MKKTKSYYEKLNKPFRILSICREDLIISGIKEKKAMKVSDADMEYIAEKMSDAFCEINSYWLTLDEVLRIMKLQK